MIKYNLNNINKWYLGNGNPIAKMYHGSTVAYDVTGGGEPTPPTPSFDGKWLATYSDSHTESAACDSTSAITGGEIDKTNLVDVQIGQCVTSIGKRAFQNCTSLTSIDIPDSVTSIDTGAFHNCNSLTSIDIPSGVTSIGGSAFYNCTSLTSIDIPSGVTSIRQSAFADCVSLTSITCNAVNPPTLGSNTVFDNTNSAHIYVPSASVNAYKSASGWSAYASRIQAIPT